MNLKRILPLWLVVALCPTTALAQDEDNRPFIYATYFNCNPSGEDRADKIVEDVWKRIYDKAVDDGDIISWGWLAHHTGGKWRRLNYYTAGDVEALLAAGDKLGDQVQKRKKESDEFASICSSHDDYIWQSVTGSGGSQVSANRGKVGMSVYHVCDMTKESRADEIVKQVIGPVFDEHTGDGKLSSWGWSTHVVGGKYRRISTMTAPDWSTLFKMRSSIFAALDGNTLADQFSEICGSHSDYMWELKHEKP